MTIAYSCVLFMILFPYFFTVLAKSNPSFNNHDPRTYLENLQGWRKRANYVQLNSFETTPAFAIAVIIASILHKNQFYLDMAALIFVLSRIFYGLCYLTDKAGLRTLFWSIGMVCIVGLFCIP